MQINNDLEVNFMDNKFIKLSSLNEAKAELLKLSDVNNIKTPNWSLYKILVHCTQTIEYSMKGYPKLKPKIIQNTIGKIAINKFLKQGFMKHDLAAPVPESPEISKNGDAEAALQGLISMIDNFNNYNGELYPHLLFGKLPKDMYDKYFAMHIADHLLEVKYI